MRAGWWKEQEESKGDAGVQQAGEAADGDCVLPPRAHPGQCEEDESLFVCKSCLSGLSVWSVGVSSLSSSPFLSSLRVFFCFHPLMQLLMHTRHFAGGGADCCEREPILVLPLHTA
jgi:hypothetical protein